MTAIKTLPTPPKASNNLEHFLFSGNLTLANSITLGSGIPTPIPGQSKQPAKKADTTLRSSVAVRSSNKKIEAPIDSAVTTPARRGPGRPRIHPIVEKSERRGPGRPRLYPLVGPVVTSKAAPQTGVQATPETNEPTNAGSTPDKKRLRINQIPGIKSAAHFRKFPGGGKLKPIAQLEQTTPTAEVPQIPQQQPSYGYVPRAWESVSAQKAAAYYPELDSGFLENKFRWGAFKAFATSRGGPIVEISYPAAAAYGMNWLVERNYAKRENNMLTLRNKGRELYNLLFKNRGPRDFLL